MEKKEEKIETVDIWSNAYTTCLQGHLREVKKVDGKTLYRSDILNKFYFLTDSRYGDDFYL